MKKWHVALWALVMAGGLVVLAVELYAMTMCLFVVECGHSYAPLVMQLQCRCVRVGP